MPNNTISPELIEKFRNINKLIKEEKIDEAKAAASNLSTSEKSTYLQWTKDQIAKQQEASHRVAELKRRQEELAAREQALLARQQALVAERESIMRECAKKLSKR